MACFLAFAGLKPSIERVHIEAAAVELKGPGKLKVNEVSDERSIQKSFEALPKPFRDAVEHVVKMAAEGEIPLLQPISVEPLALKMISEPVQGFVVARVICTSELVLPLEAAKPWQWTQWWHPVLVAGEAFGEGFSRGLLRMSAESSKASLNIRGMMGGVRPVAIRAVGMLCQIVTSVDLRDNELSSEELGALSDALTTADTIQKLIIAGNPLSGHDLSSVFAKLAARGSSKLTEVDASRTQLMDDSGSEHPDAVSALAQVVTNGGALSNLRLSQAGLSDAASASFITALVKPSPPLKPGTQLKLMELNLSRNQLGGAFAKALSAVAKLLTRLATLDLSHNNFGAEAGVVVIRAALAIGSLSTLDLSSTNLCDCRPLHASPGASASGARAYCTTAIEALVDALKKSRVAEIALHGNELCGVWPERICGETVMRGEYSTAGIDLLAGALEAVGGDGIQPISLRKDGLSFAKDNFLRPVEAKRLTDALVANSTKASVTRLGGGWLKKKGAGGLFGKAREKTAQPTQETTNPLPEQLDGPSPPARAAAENLDAAQGTGAANSEAAPPDSASAAASFSKQNVAAKSPQSPDSNGKASAKGASFLKRAGTLGALSGVFKQGDASPAVVPGVDPNDTRPLNVRLGALIIARNIKFAELMHDWDDDGSGTIDAKEFRINLKKLGLPATDKECKELFSELDGDGSGELDLGEMKKALKTMVDAAKEAEEAERKRKEAEELAKKPKIVVPVKVYSHEKPTAPLMVVVAALKARKDAAINSPLVANSNVLAGSLVYIIEQQELHTRFKGKPEVEVRMLIQLEGDTQPLGWVTGITKDEVEQIKLAAAGFPLWKAMRQLPVRDGKDSDAHKVCDVFAGTKLRVLQEYVAPDNCERVRLHPRMRRRSSHTHWLTE